MLVAGASAAPELAGALQGERNRTLTTRNLKTLGLALVAVFACSAMAASAAQASPADFAADGYPATVKVTSEGTQQFVTNTGTTFSCEGFHGDGTLTEEGNSLTIGNLKWTECSATVLKIPLTFDPNGCEFTFTSGKLVSDTEESTAETGGTSTGSVHIINCENETQGITITIGAEGKTCHIDVPQGTPNSGSIHYSTIEEAGLEHVTVNLIQVNVNIDYTGGNACEGETNNAVAGNATYNGQSIASGENELEEDTNLTITGTEKLE